MNRDVFLSILAMDSYNRRYNQGVAGLADTGLIGNATILTDSVSALGSTSSNTGFYAIAYDYEGATVIAFRGTDPTDGANIVRDLVNGWSTFSGLGTNTDSPRRTVH